MAQFLALWARQAHPVRRELRRPAGPGDTGGVVVESVIVNIKPGTAREFEGAFDRAAQILVRMPGYLSHELLRSVEKENRYLLQIRWRTLEHHTKVFRLSPEYEQWAALLHRFFSPLPAVEHYAPIKRPMF